MYNTPFWYIVRTRKSRKKMANSTVELVFIPATALGHIMSIVELAKLLVKRYNRISITVLVMKPPPGTGPEPETTAFFRSTAAKAVERLRFIELPQNETPVPKLDPKAFLTYLNDYFNSHSKYVRNVVSDMVHRPGFGYFAGFVVDVFCAGMALEVGKEFDAPTYLFMTSGAGFLGFNFHLQELLSDTDTENQDVFGFDSEFPVPSFVNPLPAWAIPANYRTKDGLDQVRKFGRKQNQAKAILVNTFLELEPHAFESFSAKYKHFPPVYPVGPLLNLDGAAGKPHDSDVIKWLDGQPPSSVVFLCFGSMGYFDDAQVKEIAYGLERSGHRFLWSLRRHPPPEQTVKVPGVYEDDELRAVLPEGFLDRTGGIGRVIGWAPQAAVLAHRAVGGFVSHCGWNSVLESVWFGVPLAAWPIYSEQQMNAFQLVVELGLAVEIKLDYKKDVFNPDDDSGIVTAAEIEGGIRRLMEDTQVRATVKEMSGKSRAATMVDGSSYSSINRLIQDFVTKNSS